VFLCAVRVDCRINEVTAAQAAVTQEVNQKCDLSGEYKKRSTLFELL
jgi:hypothetical protein